MSISTRFTKRFTLSVANGVAAVLMLSGSIAGAADSVAEHTEGVDALSGRLMISSGMEAAAARFGETSSASIVARVTEWGADREIDEGQLRTIVEAAETSFAPLSMSWIAERHLRAALSDSDIETLLEHHESPFGRQLRAAVMARSATADPDAFAEFVAAFGQEDGDADRFALLRRLVNESSMHERIAQLMIDMQVVSLHGTFAMISGNARDSLDAAVDRVNAGREALEQTMLDSLPVMLAYTYDGFDTEQHRQLLAVSLSEPSRRAADAMLDGLREAYVAATFDFQRRVRPPIALAAMPDGI